MAVLDIPQGTRLQLCFAPELGEKPDFDMSASFFKSLDDSSFLLSIPMKGGKPVQVDETQKLLLRYGEGDEIMFVTAYCDDVVKQGIRNYWKLRRVSENRQYFQRKDERYKAALGVKYTSPMWPLKSDGTIDYEDGITLDISAGGLAMYLSTRFDVGAICKLSLPAIESEGVSTVKDIVSAVCWYREAPIGSPHRFVCGIQFRFADDGEKDDVRNYIASVKHAYRL